MMRAVAIFLVCVVESVILTSIVSTQLVLADIQRFGLAVTIGDRLHATQHDLLGLALPLLGLIGLSFLVAFFIARHAFHKIGGNMTMWYMAAGFTSFPVTLFLIRYFMGITLLASARTPTGMILVASCCMTGGWLYAFLDSRYAMSASAGA